MLCQTILRIAGAPLKPSRHQRQLHLWEDMPYALIAWYTLCVPCNLKSMIFFDFFYDFLGFFIVLNARRKAHVSDHLASNKVAATLWLSHFCGAALRYQCTQCENDLRSVRVRRWQLESLVSRSWDIGGPN